MNPQVNFSTWSLVLGLFYYCRNWNWLRVRYEILESCRATAASLCIPCRTESTEERKVNALIFPTAAATAAPVAVECEVTGPLLAGTVIVLWETDHRSSITSAMTVARTGQQKTRRLLGDEKPERQEWLVQSLKFSHFR